MQKIMTLRLLILLLLIASSSFQLGTQPPHGQLFWIPETGKIATANWDVLFKGSNFTNLSLENIPKTFSFRRMYWTDWGTVAKIERASMDGTSREVLHNTSLIWPNALTLDYDTQILYWMDASLDKFESSNADGSNRRLLSTTQIYHPFGITFYQNTVYWTDWQMNSILSAPISRPTQVTMVITGLALDPMGISVVSVNRQPTG